VLFRSHEVMPILRSLTGVRYGEDRVRIS
jgi:hypothetical protein